ncbi:MAG TPA: SRPBCC family protein [Flavobacteriales bacterium]|nr:SRPBCC family protein [Flavobacteriales bacterium]
MRALKTILIILLALVGLLVILGLVGPSNYRVERSTTIAAPPAVVYGYVSHLSSMKEWGPWQAMDKDQVQRIEGTDGTVGATWHWEGDTVGTGSQKIVSLEPNKNVRCELHFIEPFESISTATYDLEPVGDSTRITWGMEGENTFMGKIMGVFMDMDKMIGPDFEKGLANLKALAEEEQAAVLAEKASRTVDGYLIETVEGAETVYIGMRDKKLKWKDMGAFFGTHFPAIGAALGAAQLEMAGAPSGVYWAWNDKDQTTDMMAAMPVKGDASTQVAGYTTHVVPAGRRLKVAYYGDYTKNMDAHLAIDTYIREKGLTHYGNVIEEYVTDPMAEPDTAKWLTNIYYMVK